MGGNERAAAPTPTLVSRALPLLSNVEIVQRGQGWVEMSAPDPRAAASATAAGALLPPTGRAARASAVLPGPLVLLQSSLLAALLWAAGLCITSGISILLLAGAGR